MTQPLKAVAYIQDGLEFYLLDDVNERRPYFVVRSDGSMIREPGIGGNPMAARIGNTLKSMLTPPNPFGAGGASNFASDPHSGSNNGQPLTGKTIAAVKNYLREMYGLGAVPDSQVGAWLDRATKIDDATATHEDFYDRLVKDVAAKEGAGNEQMTAKFLEGVMGAQGYDRMVNHLSGLTERESFYRNDPVNYMIESAAANGLAALKESGASFDSPDSASGGTGAGSGAGAGSRAGAGSGAGGGNYEIQAGDTLSAIAARYGTTVSAIAEANGIADPNKIIAGQSIVIPGAGDGVIDNGAGSASAGAEGGAGGSASAGGIYQGGGGGIGSDLEGSTGGTPVPETPGAGPGGAEVTPDLLKRFIDSNWRLAFNAWVNRFRDAGAASIFLDFLYNSAQQFFAEWEGGIAEQALQGKLPSGSFSEYLSELGGGLIEPLTTTRNSPVLTDEDLQYLTGTRGSNDGRVSTGTNSSSGGGAPEVQPGPGPIPSGSAPINPAAGQAPGLQPLSPDLAAVLGV